MMAMALDQRQNEEMNVAPKIGLDDNVNETIVKALAGRTVQRLQAAMNYDVVTSSELKEQLKAHFDAALAEYFQLRDDPRQFDKFKFVLIAELKNAFKDVCLDYTNKCSAYLTSAGLRFRSQVDALVESKCLPLDNLNAILRDVTANVIQHYEASPAANVDHLKKRLNEESQQYISENNVRLGQLYRQYNSILNDLIEKYEDVVQMRLPDDELELASEQKLESVFSACQKMVVKLLNAKMQFDDPEMKKMFETRIVNVLGERFADKVTESRKLKEKKFADAGIVVSDAVDRFEKLVSAVFGEMNSESELINFRNAKMNELIIEITDHIYDILHDSKEGKRMIELAKKKMEQIFRNFQSQRVDQTEAFHREWDAELNSICEQFNRRFNELCQPEILPDLDELRAGRDVVIRELIGAVKWLNNVRNETDLRESFERFAQQQMAALSEPILQTHSKLLERNFEWQKREMIGCLEAHQMKMNELLKGDVTDDVCADAITLGDAAIENFEQQIRSISPISPAATRVLREDLKREISRIQNRFDAHVKDRKLMVRAELAQLVSDSVDDYKQLIGAFSIATNFTEEKLAQIHNNLKSRAQLGLQKDLRMAKFTAVAVVREQQAKLESAIDKAYSDAIAAIGNQRAERNQKLDACNRKAYNHYKQLFNSKLGSVANEEELLKLHGDYKAEATALWEEMFPIHYFGDKLLPELRKFAKQLDAEFETSIRSMWNKINTDVDRDTRNAVETLVQKYEEQMIFELQARDYISDDVISSNHRKFAGEARKGLENVDKPKNINKSVYIDLLSNRLDSTLECIRTQNSQKKEAIRSDLLNECLQLKQTLEREMLNWKVFPESSGLLNKYKEQVRHFADRLQVDNITKHELVSFAEEKGLEMGHELHAEWDNIQPDPNQLQLAINTAVAEYNREMENRTTKSGLLFNSAAMKKQHANSLQVVRMKFEESVKQTAAARQQFDKSIEEMRKKFEDLNDLRAAEHSEATIGIDLGTTFSCVAIYKGGKIEIIPDREHHSNTVPSYVFYESATKTVVGHSAKDQSVIHPQTTIFDSKRLIGRRFDDRQTQKDITQWPFKVIRDPNVSRKEPKIEVHGKTFHPEEVSGEILKHLKRNAELYLGRPVNDVVITVPAYFNDAQKRATKSAAACANINVLEIINEPTSAAIAYSLNYTDGKGKNILVFDLGGGTFDVSVLSTEQCNIKVKAVGGDNHLGGEDFDSNLVDFCIEKFRQTTGLTIPKNVSGSLAAAAAASIDEGSDEQEQARKVFETLRRLRQKCELAKINLSKTDTVRVVVDYIYNQKNLDVEITVEDFNEMNAELFDKCIKIVKDTVNASKLTKAEIDDVVLVGGSSRIPEVQRLLSEFFDGKSLIMTLNPDEVVAQGAAYRAAMISGSKTRELADVKFQDVNPLSLGIEVIGKRFSVILPKNTPLPAKRTETYITTRDYQTQIIVSIYEGDDEKVANNNLLGEFTLLNIPSKRRGQEPVDVTIECDSEGLIHVTAKVRSNQSSDEIKIQSERGGLTAEDIKKVIERNTENDE